MNSGIIQATLSVVVWGGLSIWCGVCIAEEAEEAKSDDEFPSPLPVYVLPYYHSKGPWVSVGKFSSEPNSADSESILRVARQMTKDWQTLTLEQMHVTAIRLFDLGHRDEAVYWFQSLRVSLPRTSHKDVKSGPQIQRETSRAGEDLPAA